MTGPDRTSGLYIPIADTLATRNSIVRHAMESFLGELNQTNIQSELIATIEDAPQSKSYHEEVDLFSYSSMSEAITTIDPPWDDNQLHHELLKMNHPTLWFKLLVRATQQNKDVLTDLIASDPLSQPSRLLSQASDTIAHNNMRLFGKTLINYGLAAAYGETHYPIVTSSTNKSFENNEINPRYQAGEKASQLFDSPASSAREVVDRLQQLFPQDQPIDTIPAYRFAKNTHAFFTRKSRETQAVTCAGIDTTGLLFSAYGNILAGENYQRQLIQSIENNSFK